MSGPHQSEADLLVLHALRCVGFAEIRRVAKAAGVDPSGVVLVLRRLVEQGLAAQVEGPFEAWGITDLGREEDASRIEHELEYANARAAVEETFEQFLELNPRLLQVCHDWQMHSVGGTPVLNDHSDAEYDVAVIERLARIDRSVGRLLETLATRLARFGTYRARLSDAFRLVDRGEHAYFTDDLESYHTVWFQLHEDLLTTLGRPREW